MVIHAETEPATRAVRRSHADRATVAEVRVGPWSRRQCTSLAVVHAVALGVIVLSYWKSSGQSHVADQITWLNVSIAALVVVCGMDWLFFAAGHRRAGYVRQTLFVAAPAAASVESTVAFVAVEGARRFHVAGCAFVAGKAVTGASRDRHVDAGRVPCEVCLPGDER